MVQEYLITFPHPLHHGIRVFDYIPQPYIMVQKYLITFPHALHHGTRVQYTPRAKYLMGVKFYDFFHNIHYFPSKKGLPSATGKWHNNVCPLLKGGGGAI